MHADLPRFLGSAEHALDDKGRLIVPARFRERLGPGFVITIALNLRRVRTSASGV